MFREPRLAQKRLRFLIFNMLLTASNTLFKLGVRPRAVTTPVRVHNHSGTCGETSTREDLRPILRPSPTQTARKVHYFFTVRLREYHPAIPPASCAFSARRTNTEVTAAANAQALPFITGETWRQAGQNASAPRIQSLAAALVASGSSAGIKSEQHESLDPDSDPGPCGAPSPEVDVAGQLPRKGARAIEEDCHGRPITAPHHHESPLARARAGRNVPPAHIETFPKHYRLSIALPRPGGAQFASEMITVSARRGGRLAVVADAWHLEHDCHFEWHFAFPGPDIDLEAVRARLGKDGILVIDVPRRRG
ncbi:hypothetical protein DFH94DRAFT_850349 [Russula ochroleuca]|uniref:SHSP domain-containing protein n=1 Tax=Russula ochroleuca TaxID=152965 RepID=A0A9P5N503_9AGAM|nr:hypothetical protein DFH94DRAFT_850349 [Russula ochroleuca]